VAVCVYVALVHVALALALLKSDFLFRANERLGWSLHLAQMADRYYRFTSHTQLDRTDARIAKQRGNVLMGDSIVRDLPADLAVTNSINLGLGGLRTSDLPHVMARYPSLHRASALIIGIGLNDFCIDRAKAGEFAQRVQLLSAALPEKTPVYWLSITPLSNTAAAGSCGVSARDIAQANIEIATSCARLPACRFVDVRTPLADGDGHLRSEFHYGDGIHLSRLGYERWKSTLDGALRPAVPKVPGNTASAASGAS
jgi:lysophospholipase L1-like esterase